MSSNIGDSGSISGVGNIVDAGHMTQSTPRSSLSDVSFSSLLRGATDLSDYLNVPNIDDSDTQP